MVGTNNIRFFMTILEKVVATAIESTLLIGEVKDVMLFYVTLLRPEILIFGGVMTVFIFSNTGVLSEKRRHSVIVIQYLFLKCRFTSIFTLTLTYLFYENFIITSLVWLHDSSL